MAILPNRSDSDDSGVWPRIDSVAAAAWRSWTAVTTSPSVASTWPIVVAPCAIVDEKLPDVDPAASSVVAVLSIVTEIVVETTRQPARQRVEARPDGDRDPEQDDGRATIPTIP